MFNDTAIFLGVSSIEGAENYVTSGNATVMMTSLALSCPDTYYNVNNTNGYSYCALSPVPTDVNNNNGGNIVSPPNDQKTSSPIVYIIAGCVAAVVVVLIIAIALFLLYRAKQRRAHKRFVSTIDMSQFIPQFQKNTVINESELKNMVQVSYLFLQWCTW